MKIIKTKPENFLLRKEESSRLINGAVKKMYLPSFLLALTFNINGLIDSMLAGIFFSPLHIAAIGVVLPIQTLFMALLQIFVQGTYSNYTTALGRGQRRKGKEVFTVGLVYLGLLGVLFAAVCIVFAEPIVTLFGAATESLRQSAAIYLRFTSIAYPLTAITKMITLILGVYGYKKSTLAASVTNLICNVAFSVLFLFAIPQIGFGALGLGTLFATIPALFICYFSAKRHGHPIELKARLYGFRAKRFKELISCGIGVSLNVIIDGLICGLINNIIIGSSLGADGLALYSVVLCFWQLSHVSAEGMDYAVGPIMGVCYSCKNKSDLEASAFTAIKKGVFYTVCWVLMIFALTPLLLKLYLGTSEGIENAVPIVWGGIIATLVFAPAFSLVQTMTGFYDTTESLSLAIIFSVIPDSVLFPLMLMLLLPHLGYLGIWLSLGGNTVVFFGLFYLALAIIKKRKRLTSDDFLNLNKGICAEYPAIDIAINNDFEEISHIAEKIQHFLKQENAASKVSYLTALCVDELATDIAAHSKNSSIKSESSVMNLRIISSDDVFCIIISNVAEPYDPLDFEYKNDDFSKVGLMMVQKIAKKIDYNYIYKMNMITIQIEK